MSLLIGEKKIDILEICCLQLNIKQSCNQIDVLVASQCLALY